MSQPAKPYKETLNLPVTRFDMKANLKVREPEVQARWRTMGLYQRIREARAGAPRKVLHDGPPYANGEIHMGHLLNKVLKDVVVRYLTMRGLDSPYVPGWDCHGLPIEHKVLKDLGPQAAALSASEVRARCRDEALHWVDVQRKDFQRLGVEGDWDNPYLTLDPRYEAGVLDVLADLVESGLVFRQLKPIHWCFTDQTALAEAELEYVEETTISIYVHFDMVAGVPAPWGPGPWRLMIWTTTPWTLPANVAVAAHPNLEYVGLRFSDPTTGETAHTIVAAELAAKVMSLKGVEEAVELGRCRGRDLEHAEYRHPFLERVSPVVLADYVSVEDGTGLVHTAPGHGAEDYLTGRRYELSVLSPVDGAGRFTTEAPDWLQGKGVLQANPKIVDHLKTSGHLYNAASLAHSYPHCWRCKKPVIFRATEQWFIAVDHNDLRGRTLKQIESVRWLPAWGQNRIESMVALRPDWCVSRQRSWGVPIPALHNERTGETHLTAASVRFFRDLFQREGADAWYTKPIGELVPPDLDLNRFPLEHLARGTDILDVWFESGSSHRAVLKRDFNLGYPAFMYLEGSDQHRGWFQSSILTAVGSTGVAPFETVLTHGFVVDEQGRKISKALGNYVAAVEMTDRYGADVLRLFVSGIDYADDVRVSERLIKETSDVYRKIRNTFRYMLGNLEDYARFDPNTFDAGDLHEIDRWALGQLNAVIRDVTAAFDRFDFYRATQRIYQFCSVDLSSFYLDVLKDRLYAERPDGPDRRAAQFVMARSHSALTRLLAPIMPHTTEELWDFAPERKESVHLADWPEADPRWDNPTRDEQFARLMEVRERVFANAIEPARRDKLIGGNQEALVEIVAEPTLARALQRDLDLLTTLLIVSEVRIGAGEADQELTVSARKSSHPKCERCWNLRVTVGRHEQFPTLCDRCVRVLKDAR